MPYILRDTICVFISLIPGKTFKTIKMTTGHSKCVLGITSKVQKVFFNHSFQALLRPLTSQPLQSYMRKQGCAASCIRPNKKNQNCCRWGTKNPSHVSASASVKHSLLIFTDFVYLFITSRVSGRGYKNGAVCLCVSTLTAEPINIRSAVRAFTHGHTDTDTRRPQVFHSKSLYTIILMVLPE